MSDVNFDPENGSRMVQLARGVIFAQIRALKRSDKYDECRLGFSAFDN